MNTRDTQPSKPFDDEMPHAILWIDVETTGLDPAKDVILELAYILTEFEHPYRVIKQGATLIKPDEGMTIERIVSMMHPIVKDMHTKSGLIEDLKNHSAKAPTRSEVEATFLELSTDWPTEKERKVVIGGNSPHFDKKFMEHEFPSFARRLSHRTFDASGQSLVGRSLRMPRLPKEEPHRAALDVENSIIQMKKVVHWMLTVPGLAVRTGTGK